MNYSSAAPAREPVPKLSENDYPATHPMEQVEDGQGRTLNSLRNLWEQRRILLCVALCALILSTLIAFLIPPKYESTARLMPPEQAGGNAAAMLGALAGKVGSLTPLAESALGLRTTGNLFVGILQSWTVQDDLIQKFGLQKLYGTPYIEDARRQLAAHTDIPLDTRSGIITVSVTDRSPQRAAAMAQEYIDQLNWVVNNLTTSSARRERVFLEERLKQVKDDMESAEQHFSQFASQKGAIDIQTQGKATVEAAATLQGQLIAAESELEGLRQIYTENNVRVRSLQARVAELRRQLQKIGGKGINENSQVDDLYPSIRQLPLLGVSYADLFRRVKVEEALFETFTEEYELAKVQEAKEIPTVKVLDRPTVPQKKSFPPRLLMMVLSTMLALIAGTAWVLAQAMWDATDTSDPRKALASKVWSDVREALPWASRNGSGMAQPMGWLRKKIRRSKPQNAEAVGWQGGREHGEAGEAMENAAEQQREPE